MARAARRGIVDCWNAFMVEGAMMCEEDIPLCPTIVAEEPKELISWKDAKALVKRQIAGGCGDFHISGLVHFYLDDQRFDGVRSGIWQYPQDAMDVLRHFDGIITPDYSLYQDLPKPAKLFNVYRMRAFGYWAGRQGLQVMNNVRWGTAETWDYCFVGIPVGSQVCVGAVASGLKRRVNRTLFNDGFAVMLDTLCPAKVLFYGRPSEQALRLTREREIPTEIYSSDMAARFQKAGCRE